MPESSDRVKEFFITWMRLMERHNDALDLTDGLHSVLVQAGDTAKKLQDAKQQADMLSANEKTISELVALINDFFFRDIVVAPKPARHAEKTGPATQSQGQDLLDRYLEQGDDDSAMPQAFVDNMSGWAAPARAAAQEQAPCGQSAKKKKLARSISCALRASGDERDEAEAQSDEESDDEIPSDSFHDLLITNGLKFTAMQAPDYPGMVRGWVIQQQNAPGKSTTTAQAAGAPARMSTSPTTTSATAASPRVARNKGELKTSKRRRVVPPSILTNLPPRSEASTPHTQSRSPDAAKNKDRIGKQAATNLTADQVLGVRTYGKMREYFVRWQGITSPLWITRRKAPPQAKELIDLYAAELRARDSDLANERAKQAGGDVQKRKKHTSRNGKSLRQRHPGTSGAGAQAEFYTVDYIVNHRMFYNSREYLVRWENYDESEDTWENATELRADVPDIVDAYEEQLQREHARAEAAQSAISELNRDSAAGTKESAKKRGIAKAASGGEAGDDKTAYAKGKRRLIVADSEGENQSDEGDDTSEDDYQFTLEEAEVEELSDDEFADKLNT